MTSENTARKVHVKQYLARYGAAPGADSRTVLKPAAARGPARGVEGALA